jgi:hypothetical protein
MAVTIEFRQTRDVTVEGKFRVFTEILSTTEFRADTTPPLASTLSLFTFERTVPDPTYQHVSKVGDVEHWANKDDPAHSSDQYYRDDSAELFFDTVEEAQTEADVQKTRFQQLVDDYAAYVNTFTVGSPETDTYSS